MLNYIGFIITQVRILGPEAQVWVGVKIPRPGYLDPHPVFLTHCAISHQNCLENGNI